MSLVGTLGKVAMGIMVAKGVGKMMGGSAAGGAGGGLGGLLGKLQGGGAGASGGGLGGLLGQLQGGASGGGLGDMLGKLQGGGGGGLGDLGSLLGGGTANAGATGQSGGLGGLGGLLESLGGGGAAAGAGGLGGLLNSALQGDKQAPAPTQSQEETAKILIQAMVNAAKSDGNIDQAEQQKIVSNLGDEVSEEERKFVLSEMQAPLDADSFIRSVPRGAEQQVYLMSLMAIDLDSKEEAQYLDKLRQGLNMTTQASNAIHEQLGVATLYS